MLLIFMVTSLLGAGVGCASQSGLREFEALRRSINRSQRVDVAVQGYGENDAELCSVDDPEFGSAISEALSIEKGPWVISEEPGILSPKKITVTFYLDDGTERRLKLLGGGGLVFWGDTGFYAQLEGTKVETLILDTVHRETEVDAEYEVIPKKGS